VTLLLLLDQPLQYQVRSSAGFPIAFGAEFDVGEIPAEFGSTARGAAVVPVALSESLARNQFVPAEWTGSTVATQRDGAVPIAVSSGRQSSPGLPSQTAAGRNRDAASSVETGSLRRVDARQSIGVGSLVQGNGSAPLGLGRSAVSSGRVLIEFQGVAGGSLVRDTVVPLEWNFGIFLEEISIEFGALVRGAAHGPIATGADVVVGEIPIEFGAQVRRGTTVPIELVASAGNSPVARDALGPLEFGRIVTLSRSVPIEISRTVLLSRFGLVEPAAARASGLLVPFDQGSGSRRSSASPIDLADLIFRGLAAPVEFGGGANRNSSVPTEWATLATITSVAVNRAIALEWSTFRTRDHRAALEILAARSAAVPVLIETAGSVRSALATPEEAAIVTALNRQGAVDLGAGRSRQLIAPAAFGSLASRSAVIPADLVGTTISLARDFAASFGWNTRRVNDGAIGIEVLTRSLRSLGIPIEMRSITTSVGTSYVLLLEIAPHLTVIGYAFGSDAPLGGISGSDARLADLESDDAPIGRVTGTDI
jgi:hypothetical protein